MAKIIDITPRAKDIRPVLMLITSHRMDCFMLCLKSLELYTDLSRFKKIYILANDVSDDHSLLIKAFQNRHQNVIDVHITPRGQVPAVVAMENFIMERHRDEFIIRMSEDVFVTPRWLEHMIASHKMHRKHDHVPVTSALTPVSRTGRQIMDRVMRAHYSEERRRLPALPVEENAVYHRLIWEKILFDGLMDKYFELERPKHFYLGHVSSDLIMFDSRLMDRILPMQLKDVEGVARVDEFHINGALRTNDLRAAVVTDCVVHHFSHAGPEEFLRRHISLDDVWWFMTFLKETIGYQEHSTAQPTPMAASRQELARLMKERELRILK